MSTALVTFGKEPLAMAPQIEQVDPKSMCEVLANQIWGSIKSGTVARTKSELFRVFATLSARNEEMWKHVQFFIRAVIRANAGKDCRMFYEWERCIQEASGIGKNLRIEYKPLAQLAIKSDEEIRRTLAHELKKRIGEIVLRCLEALEVLRLSEIVGGIRFLTEDVCQGYFYRWSFTETYERYNGSDGVHTSHTTTAKHQVHLHEVINAKVYTVGDAATKAILKDAPKEVHELLGWIPSGWSPHVKIIDGDEIFRGVYERTVATETSVQFKPHPVEVIPHYFHDPFVVLGNYVLTGW